MSERLGTRAGPRPRTSSQPWPARVLRAVWGPGRPASGATRHRGRAWAAWGAGALAAACLAGCGSAVTVGADRTLRIAVGEYQLRPNAARMSPGQVTIVVQNLGRLSHDLVVAEGDHWLGATKPIWPGQSATLTLDLAAGSYSMFSALLSDQSLGAYGTITVTP